MDTDGEGLGTSGVRGPDTLWRVPWTRLFARLSIFALCLSWEIVFINIECRPPEDEVKQLSWIESQSKTTKETCRHFDLGVVCCPLATRSGRHFVRQGEANDALAFE